MSNWDYLRFLETMDFYHKTPQPAKLSDFRRGLIRIEYNGSQKELVKILVYCLMPNHFHLLVQQLMDNGVSTFLSNLTNSYTRYFNTKYDRVGSLFQGPFKARLVATDEYLLQVSKYIHRNPYVFKEWRSKIYPYSSYSCYLSQEKHPFCDPSFILSYFSNTIPNLTYKSFVEETNINTESDTKLPSLFIEEDEL